MRANVFNAEYRKFCAYMWYRARGYTALEAITDMRSARPMLYSRGASVIGALSGVECKLSDARIVYDAYRDLYTARCSAVYLSDRVGAVAWMYSRKGLTARSAYKALSRMLRQDQMTIDHDSYWRALRHGQIEALDLVD